MSLTPHWKRVWEQKRSPGEEVQRFVLFISSISVGWKDLADCHTMAGKIGAGRVSLAGALNNERRLPSTSRRDVQLASHAK